MNCIKCIISVISNANMCKLFDIYNDVEKTMFNYYLLEIIPILNKFYDKLVSMTLPTQLNDFIFCPASIYFHNLYGETERFLYQSESQINGTAAHSAIDQHTYSDRKNIYCATLCFIISSMNMMEMIWLGLLS